jgi:hypothetical protein
MSDPLFFIWSEEHGAWWKADGNGYSRSIFEAGRFSFGEAMRITSSANQYSEKVNEVALFAILLTDDRASQNEHQA